MFTRRAFVRLFYIRKPIMNQQINYDKPNLKPGWPFDRSRDRDLSDCDLSDLADRHGHLIAQWHTEGRPCDYAEWLQKKAKKLWKSKGCPYRDYYEWLRKG